VLLAALSVAMLAIGCNADGPAEPSGGIGRVDFAPNPNPPVAGNGVVVDVYIEHAERSDAIVFEFKAGIAGGWVEYVDKQDVISCGPGEVVPLQGAAALKVHFDGAGQHEDYVPTGAPIALTGAGSIIEAKRICDFEAVLEWGIGTSGVQNFSVSIEDNPRRVIVRVSR
jgi:hypothetical protein